MSATPLFRAQALAYATVRQYGSIVLLRPVGVSWLLGMFCLIAAAVLFFFATADYTRKEQVGGVLMPTQGLLRVQSLQPGLVLDVRVHENQSVHTGDVLFVIKGAGADVAQSDPDGQIVALLHTLRDKLSQKQHRLRDDAGKSDALRRQALELGEELERVDKQILTQRRRVALSDSVLTRTRHTVHGCFTQSGAYDLKNGTSVLAPAAFRSAPGRAGPPPHDCRDEASAQRQVDAIDQGLADTEAPKTMLVRATQAGVVSGVATQSGQTVAAGQVLANLSPASSPLEAVLYASARAAGMAQPGMPVQIRYQAYPFQKFGQFQGIISEVSRSPLADATAPAAEGARRSGEALYRIRVALARQDVPLASTTRPLMAGMALDANLLIETRKLYEWVLEPLQVFGARG
ncbi:biotin/lipoyl-binding protein [Paucibacter sp. B2R-40]|uniref:HlyD family secretion protein n=1 Tax=Paucibacter sp. B2R-40 TaxID=2893554 RepID=UPI0021E40220|nr:biotin/lipoyl-binding protein [Paucibacter sp. B2R-40]MCV2353175.1 biotin/lipoyl-binding protein [Paucibacter sp. B2R-40]